MHERLGCNWVMDKNDKLNTNFAISGQSTKTIHIYVQIYYLTMYIYTNNNKLHFQGLLKRANKYKEKQSDKS